MKLYLLILLFVIFVIVAFLVYLKYYCRYVVFKDMVYICKSLKNNISFNKNTIANLLENAKTHISTISKNIINQIRSVKKCSFITKDDVVDIENFIKSLGRGDVQYEINNINYYENEFIEKKNLTKELLNRDGKMYLKLIIGIGLAVCIILI